MRISDWSSDVCSSDLSRFPRRLAEPRIKSGVTTRGEGRLRVLCANPDTQPLLAPARPARVRERHIMTLILGLESSCDETAAALVDSERRSEVHTSTLKTLMRISYAVFSSNKTKPTTNTPPF